MAVAFKKLPPPRKLRQLFDYDPATKALRKRLAPRSAFASHQAWGIHNAKAGQEIKGAPSEMYARVCIGYSRFPVHRIIWKMMTGREPPQIDHINGDSHDNRWANLRRCTTSQNGANRRPNQGRDTKGVHRDKWGGWVARIQVRRRRLSLGRFKTKEEAYAAYMAEGKKAFGEYFFDDH